MRNVLSEYGYTDQQIADKLNKVFHEIFINEETKLYYEQGDKAYIYDTGNDDARSEGMSYGMMMAVQMGRQDIFDKLWNWSMLHMYQTTGPYAGYFAWSCAPDGTKNAEGPAPDGEEYFVMALMFASNVFGDREPPFDYSRQANNILHTMINSGQLPNTGGPMFNADNKLILFVPDCTYSDPSYNLPHFYELMSRWCSDPEDSAFLMDAAEKSREYLHLCCNPITGLAPDYSYFDGSPVELPDRLCHSHYSDSYRVALNIGLDAQWFGKDALWQQQEAERLQRFYLSNPNAMTDTVVTVDGKPYPERIMHPLAMLSTAAAVSAARPHNDESAQFIQRFMDADLRGDKRRYYDNCLYFFTLLTLSGEYKILNPN